MTLVELYNLALSYLGHDQPVVAVTDTTAEAKWCNQFFDQARREVLRLAKPNWALRTEELDDQETSTSPKFAFQYPRPGNCVALASVIDTNGDPVDFELQSDMILTDCAEGYVEFIFDEDDTELFDPLFNAALAYKLAALIAVPLTGKADYKRVMEQGFNASLSDARVTDTNEDRNRGDLKDHNAYTTARG